MICLDTNAVGAALNNPTSPVRTRIDAAIELGRPLAQAVGEMDSNGG
jgi:hypothetical protein